MSIIDPKTVFLVGPVKQNLISIEEATDTESGARIIEEITRDLWFHWVFNVTGITCAWSYTEPGYSTSNSASGDRGYFDLTGLVRFTSDFNPPSISVFAGQLTPDWPARFLSDDLTSPTPESVHGVNGFFNTDNFHPFYFDELFYLKRIDISFRSDSVYTWAETAWSLTSTLLVFEYTRTHIASGNVETFRYEYTVNSTYF